ncbi:flagellar motor protein [Candidatus Endoriftia persephone str. Guaymas]|jgi:chemotaxis protein MotA|uniref:Flagellar motor rotation protein MotA n=4 Tax=Gammaproteobacteria TaxID=1236 RepID=G2FHQ0_9GAMM|nr:flagellar motor protein [Candidatus Endoriftia persephone]EGV52240.1 flagellar motor rotation protein motA [endosymbiont of Riftia pachyptila (vent Ph05)]EGW53694.1 flagellar motor rotation protein MotA [endosymbiont of Tevnia jerichonana (vent Tica)]MBA1333080.1 flagellar motor protein [Candidatus Endoriftia persephone str. Guaymas]USF86910.1 flagellar motor protein [Candidatus Endoriftia persephone]
MRPDILSFVGLIIAFMAIIGGNWLDGGHIDALLNGPAMVIVIGGTVGAILLQTPMNVFSHAIRLTGRVFLTRHNDMSATIRKMVAWSNIARKEGLLGLERVAEEEPDPFMRKGMQLMVDGGEPEVIRSILEMEVDATELHDLQAAKVFEGMGGYSPTIGIIGAVMGLIHVMQNLADPSKLGSGIATAFVATIYGVGLANLVLLPIAAKLKTLAAYNSKYREMVIEGVVAIAEGENPRNIEMKLTAFL